MVTELDDMFDGTAIGTRTHNSLANAEITTLDRLSNMSPKALLRIKNFGRHSLRFVEAYLASRGLSLKEDFPSTPLIRAYEKSSRAEREVFLHWLKSQKGEGD